MNQTSSKRRYYRLSFAGALVIILSFYSVPLSAQNHKEIKDTTSPGSNEKRIKDIDEAIAELNKGIAKLDEELSKKDWNKVQQGINESIKKIDTEKMKADIDKALKELDVDKIKASAEEAIAKVDWDKMKADLQKVKEVEIPKIEANIKEMKPEIEKSMQEAKQGIEKAKAEMKSYKNFIDDLDRDGLINKKGDYTIKINKEELIINDKKQSSEVYNKYRSFLEEHKNVTIKKDKDGFNINNDK